MTSSKVLYALFGKYLTKISDKQPCFRHLFLLLGDGFSFARDYDLPVFLFSHRKANKARSSLRWSRVSTQGRYKTDLFFRSLVVCIFLSNGSTSNLKNKVIVTHKVKLKFNLLNKSSASS